MADADAKVLAAIEKALKKNPAATNAELREIAEKISSSVKKLGNRQFHALYPLRVKRMMAAGGSAKTKGATKKKTASRKKTAAKKSTRKAATKRTRGAAKKKAASRVRAALTKRAATDGKKAPDTEAVREVFLRFASDLTAAESRAELVKVLSNVDRYVEKAVRAMG